MPCWVCLRLERPRAVRSSCHGRFKSQMQGRRHRGDRKRLRWPRGCIPKVSNSSRFGREMEKGQGWSLETWMILSGCSDCLSCKLRDMASIKTTREMENKCSKTSRLVLLQRHPEMTLMMRQGQGDDSCHHSSTRSAVDLGLPVHVVFTS